MKFTTRENLPSKKIYCPEKICCRFIRSAKKVYHPRKLNVREDLMFKGVWRICRPGKLGAQENLLLRKVCCLRKFTGREDLLSEKIYCVSSKVVYHPRKFTIRRDWLLKKIYCRFIRSAKKIYPPRKLTVQRESLSWKYSRKFPSEKFIS